MSDPGRSALLRYLANCMRAELRAKALLALRQARTEHAKRQLVDYDRQRHPTVEQVQARARAAKRRNVARGRAR